MYPKLSSSLFRIRSPGPSSRCQQPPPISTTKSDERQPSPLSSLSHHPSLPYPPVHSLPMPQGSPIAPLSLSAAPRGSSALSPGGCALTPSSASFQEALRILYQKHTSPPPSPRPGPSTLPPVSAPPFHHHHRQQQPPTTPHHHLRLLTSGHLKRYSTDEVEGDGGPSSTSQDAFMTALATASATSQPSHPFPRRQSESGLYQLAERMQRCPPGEQMTLKRVRSEQQNVPFSMLGQQPSRPPFSFTMVLGEQMDGSIATHYVRARVRMAEKRKDEMRGERVSEKKADNHSYHILEDQELREYQRLAI
ncbi:hypothetical protein ACTXT7_012089 [Hymenolepis weldensis]